MLRKLIRLILSRVSFGRLNSDDQEIFVNQCTYFNFKSSNYKKRMENKNPGT